MGALHYVNDTAQLEFLLNSPPAPPYAAILDSDFFNREHMMRLKHEGGRNISAVLVLNMFEKFNDDNVGFSHELKCPNQYSGILLPNSQETATCSAQRPEDSWNPWGSGLLHEDFPFPIIIIPNNDTVTKLLDCFNKFNSFDYETQHLRSLCAVEIKSFMSAAVSTEVCWRRTNFINNLAQTRYCDPLEGKNIYATLFPRPVVNGDDEKELAKVNTQEKFILVTTRMDTTGMFEGVYGKLEYIFFFICATTISKTLENRLYLFIYLEIIYAVK